MATLNLLHAFETHSIQGIEDALQAGASPTSPIDGKLPIEWLIEMYTRSPRFAACLRTLLDAGAGLNDPMLEALLLDDETRLGDVLAADPHAVQRCFDLGCAYTSLRGVSALHICAEYNCIRCAQFLIAQGVDIDARSDIDQDGVGGHTPVFHTVNSNGNHCRPMMELLVEAGADIEARVDALSWGAGCPWETVLFDTTPMSYAQAGLLPQFQRSEGDVYANLDFLHRRRHGRPAPRRNVPNRYLQP